MTEWLKRLLHFGLMLGLCWASGAWAASYTLPAVSFPPCGNSWNSTQNTCGVRVILQAGDKVTASTPLTIRADAGFDLQGNNTLSGVSLQSDYGSVVVESGGQITGSIVSNWGTVTLRGSSVSGRVQGLGAMSFTNSQVGGAVSANNAIAASGSSFSAGVASSNGTVTLTGGSVRGNISSGCCLVTLTNLSVMGNINVSQNNVRLSNATVTGNITTTNRVELDKSTVYGNVTAATWDDQTIKGTGNSFIYGVCVPATTTPQKLCTGESYLPQIHHYRLSYSSQALTCRPHSVTVTACSNADCSTTYTGGTSTLTISPGGSPISFTGSATTTLAIRTAQTVTLAVANASPGASSPLLCRIDGGAASTGCSLTFASSGLLVEAPELIAARPDTLRITAVRESNKSQDCVPAFANVTRAVQLWSTHVAPDAASGLIGNPQPFVDGTAIDSDGSSPQSRNLNFDADGRASVSIRYDDAGYLSLSARYLGSAATGDEGLTMVGADLFSSRPYGLHISTPSDSACSSASVASCSVLSAAGDSFPLSIRAVAWQADNEDRTAAALSDNEVTPNFELASIGLTGTLVAPTPAEGGVAGSFYRHNADGSRTVLASYDHVWGASTDLTVSQGEVGIFQLTATPVAGSYHGQTVGGGTSALIGRFTPAYLGVTSSASLAPACGAFSYQGQLIGFAGGQPQIAVTGFNRQGAVTRNYDRGAFWRLAPPQRQPYSLIAAGRPNLAARLQSLGDAESLAIVDSGAADGRRAFDWRADGVRPADALRWQLPSPPSDEDLPLVLTAAGEHVRLRIGASELTDLDGTCYGSGGACQDFEHAFGGTELRLGRLRLDAASGPQNQALDLPYWLESWQSQGGSSVWGETLGDTCSTPAALGQVVLSGFSGGLQASDFPTPPGSLEAPPVATPTPSGVVRLPAPNKSGSVLATLSGLNGASPALPWLWFDWNGDGTPEAASARATFGVQAVQRALIFRRELYRQ